MSKCDFNNELNVAYYISRDAESRRVYRGKPVKTFEEAQISPQSTYVLILVGSDFREIRETLRVAGFAEHEDFCDVVKPLIKPDAPFEPCPVCGGTEYETFNGSAEPRKCAHCESLERHRTLAKLFTENLDTELLHGKLLHVSPGVAERRFFEQVGAKNITSVDIRPGIGDLTADICHMPEISAENFEMVLASSVLQHVYDDEAALSEIRRVLCQGGLFITNVPIKGMKTKIREDPAKGCYGQKLVDAYRIGTFRQYGEVDFQDQLGKYFQSVQCYEKWDSVSQSSCHWYVCRK